MWQLARAFAAEPAVLLLDEPFSGLDVAAASQMRRLVQQLVAERRTTVVLVSHDLIDLVSLAQRVVVVEAGQVVDDGAADQVLRRPRSRFVADLAGVTVLAGTVSSQGVHTDVGVLGIVAVKQAGGDSYDVWSGGSSVEIVVPPEAFRVSLDGAGSGWPVVVDEISMSPAGLALTVTGHGSTRVLLPRSIAVEAGVAPGDRITLGIDPCAICIYSAGTVVCAEQNVRKWGEFAND